MKLENATYIKQNSKTSLYCFGRWEQCLKERVRDAKHAIIAFGLTRPTESAKAAALEIGVKMDTVVLIAFMILELAWKSLKAFAWPCRRVVTSSTELQLWSCTESGCWASLMLVFFS
jgi:hypothetical protein